MSFRFLEYSAGSVLRYIAADLRMVLRGDLSNDPPGSERWDLLMKCDGLSTREALRIQADSTNQSSRGPAVFQHTYMNVGTGGWIGSAATTKHSEAVLWSLNFEYEDEELEDWYCIEGGRANYSRYDGRRASEKEAELQLTSHSNRKTDTADTVAVQVL
ncbi:uncharacterized protein G6M90_00g112160 [Metarhizium brunneum]|uniref:Uncharacterized protein n=1 Tax=Metarhizium brunneum TaxID=500148 RepID=A0A7D5Z7Y9_9HYPO|nr:hypothetical protein G6M90_00g112160 [Metarhizium brunneum]